MLEAIEKKLNLLVKKELDTILRIGQTGIEKETLRVDRNGVISQTDHPRSLGSALTHSFITTDFSEALLEFVTPPLADSADAIGFLDNIHRFVYPTLENECLWPASMPCKLQGEQSIRIAEYGNSNLGIMKNVYRRGLGYRYGKLMQVIAGIHVNLSMPVNFWPAWQQLQAESGEQREFVNQQYFGLIRNLQRIGWLIAYLFGASPAVDMSFSHKGVVELKQWDSDTMYGPQATSLRLGDIGYTNHREHEIGIKACYDNLSEYVKCLTHAIETTYGPYEEIGVKVNGEYRQLNANILQIENEYYSTVRPKQVAQRKEKPTHALLDRGVQYVEIRSLDLNPFSPYGLSLDQLRFIEVLFIYCLLADNKLIDRREREEIDINEYEVSHHGRKPGLQLRRQGKSIHLHQWCEEIFTGMNYIAQIMDNSAGVSYYCNAVSTFEPCITSVEETMSSKILETMRKDNASYYEFVAELAEQYCKIYSQNSVPEKVMSELETEVRKSMEQQQMLEEDRQQDFDSFLHEYLSRPYSPGIST